jgi:hypothetical protein
MLLQLLRTIAYGYQTDRLQQFPSIREVSVHLKIGNAAAQRSFETLKLEGLLISKWGSHTFIQPRSLNRQLRFRGVIAQLVPLIPFCADPVCRQLTAAVSDQLWHHQFASRLWLYDAVDATQPAFGERILAEKPDMIIWLMPSARITNLAYRLMNCGIRVIRGVAVAEIVSQLFV